MERHCADCKKDTTNTPQDSNNHVLPRLPEHYGEYIITSCNACKNRNYHCCLCNLSFKNHSHLKAHCNNNVARQNQVKEKLEEEALAKDLELNLLNDGSNTNDATDTTNEMPAMLAPPPLSPTATAAAAAAMRILSEHQNILADDNAGSKSSNEVCIHCGLALSSKEDPITFPGITATHLYERKCNGCKKTTFFCGICNRPVK